MMGNSLQIVTEKLEKMGYDIITTKSGKLCSFSEPREAQIVSLEKLFPNEICVNNIEREGELENWKELFRTAKTAKSQVIDRRLLISKRVSQRLYDGIWDLIIDAAGKGDTMASIKIKSTYSDKFSEFIIEIGLNTEGGFWPIESRKVLFCLMDDKISGKTDQECSIIKSVSFHWNLCMELWEDITEQLKLIFKEKNITVTKFVPSKTFNVELSLTARWDDGESYIREMEKYQPGGEGYLQAQDEFNSCTTGVNENNKRAVSDGEDSSKKKQKGEEK